jgi:hypothetical protein
MAVESLDILGQKVMAGLLAQEHQELADGLVDHLPPLGSGLVGFAGGGLLTSAKSELLDGGFDDTGSDSAAGGLLDGVLPGQLSLICGQSNQRPDLGFVVGLLMTFSQQIRKDLGGRG